MFDATGIFGHKLLVTRLPGQDLISTGDLLIATEASARTIVVRCASSWTARYIAAGPAITHAEGRHQRWPSAPAVRPLPALEPEVASRMLGRM